jgi:hypothetical protein
VIDGLCEKKEEYVDQLFEAGYQQNRMYPYLPEDFSVMIMNITKELQIIRIDMPEKDTGIPSCRRIYLSWNEQTGKGRYLTIERTQVRGLDLLGEFAEDGRHIEHGEAPVEGAQLQRILELIQEQPEQSARRKDT